MGGAEMSGKKNAYLLGQWGEERVAEWLRQRGCTILETRWRCRYGELDIVAADETYLRLIEVKLRKNARFYAAREAVDERKQAKLRMTAELYLQAHPTRLQPRLDVAEVYAPAGTATLRPTIHYLEDAF